jgi:tetratricopeptide (TPR) repeat protein
MKTSAFGLSLIGALLALAPLTATAAQRGHVVLEIRKQPGANAAPTMTLPNGRPAALAVRQSIPDGARIDVPARVTVVIASSDAKSTTTLRPNTSFTPISTGAGERSSIGHGSALFSVVHGALDFFQVKSDKFTASAKGTEFSVDASQRQVSFACARGTIDVAHDIKLQIGLSKRNVAPAGGATATRAKGSQGAVLAPSTVRTIDVLTAEAKPNVSYHPLDASEGVRKFGTASEAQTFYQGQFADAQQSRDPERIAAAYNNRAGALSEKGDYNRAIADYDEAIKLDRGLATAYYNRGSAYLEKGDNAHAIADFTEAIRLDPNYGYAYMDRGNAYDDSGDPDRAIADYNVAARLGPNDPDVYYNRGLWYDERHDYDRALADYTQALKLNPKYSWAVSNRGLVYAIKGDLVRAMADYNEALRLDPKDSDATYNRGLAYTALGDYDRAIADFNETARLSPKDADTRAARGFAYWANADYDRAIADYTEAIRLNPKLGQAYRNRGLAFWSKGDSDHAIADYNQALGINPKDVYAYKTRGIAYLYAGSLQQAQSDFARALELVPRDAYAALLLEIANRRGNLPSRLAQAAKQLDMKAWPAPVVRLFLGQITPAAALAAATDPNPAKQHAEVCEARFYGAELAVLKNAKQDAMQLYRQVASDCPHSLTAVAANAALRSLK